MGKGSANRLRRMGRMDLGPRVGPRVEGPGCFVSLIISFELLLVVTSQGHPFGG